MKNTRSKIGPKTRFRDSCPEATSVTSRLVGPDAELINTAISQFADTIGVPADRREAFSIAALKIVSAAFKPKLDLPEKAPKLWDDREDRQQNPIDFLHAVWGPYLEARSLYQFQLMKLDPRLLGALRNYGSKRKIDISTIIPSKWQHAEDILEGLEGVDLKALENAVIALKRRRFPRPQHG